MFAGQLSVSLDVVGDLREEVVEREALVVDLLGHGRPPEVEVRRRLTRQLLPVRAPPRRLHHPPHQLRVVARHHLVLVRLAYRLNWLQLLLLLLRTKGLD